MNVRSACPRVHGSPTRAFTLVDDSVQPARILSVGNASNQGMKGLSTTLGPLKRRILETGPVVSANIALLGDAAPGDIDEAVLVRTIAYGPTLPGTTEIDPWAKGSSDKRTFIQAGELLGEAFNDGPAFWDPSINRIRLIYGQSDLSYQVAAEMSGNMPAPNCRRESLFSAEFDANSPSDGDLQLPRVDFPGGKT